MVLGEGRERVDPCRPTDDVQAAQGSTAPHPGGKIIPGTVPTKATENIIFEMKKLVVNIYKVYILVFLLKLSA